MHRYEEIEVSPRYDEVKITFSVGEATSNKANKDGSFGAVRPRYTVITTKNEAIAAAALVQEKKTFSLGGAGELELSNGDDFVAAVAVCVAPSALPPRDNLLDEPRPTMLQRATPKAGKPWVPLKLPPRFELSRARPPSTIRGRSDD